MFIEDILTSFVIKVVFELQFDNAKEIFLILHNPKIAAMMS